MRDIELQSHLASEDCKDRMASDIEDDFLAQWKGEGNPEVFGIYQNNKYRGYFYDIYSAIEYAVENNEHDDIWIVESEDKQG